MCYALIIGLGCLRLLSGLWLGFRPFDDTYITLRYARNLAVGNGFVYNIGEHVLGTTTPLWALILALASRLGIPLEPTAFVLPLAADILTATLLFRLLVRVGLSKTVGVCAAILFLSLFDYFSLSRSGMETSGFVLVTVFALERLASHRLRWAAFLVGLACMIRPEGLILTAVLGTALFRQRSRDWIAVSLVLLSVLITWAIYAWYAFGSVVPQTIIAKAASSRHLTRLSWQHLVLFLVKGQYGQYGLYSRTYIQLMPLMTLLVGVGTLRLALKRAAEALTLLTLFPAAFAIGLAASGAFTYFTWYYGPLYPFYAALSAIGLSWFGPRCTIGGTLLLVVAQLSAGVFLKLPNDREDHVRKYREVSSVIPANPSTNVAAPEIGAVGWTVWPSRIIDLEGLVTPDAVGVHHADYVQAAQPDYIVLPGDNNADEFLSRAERSSWFGDRYKLLATVPHGVREYRTYKRLDAGD